MNTKQNPFCRMDKPNQSTAADGRTGNFESALDSFKDLDSSNGNDDEVAEPLEHLKRTHSLIISSSSSSKSDQQQQFSKKAKETINLSKTEHSLSNNNNKTPPPTSNPNFQPNNQQLNSQDNWISPNFPKEQRYTAETPPPFLVFLKSTISNQNIGKYNPIALAKMIGDIVTGQFKIYPNGLNSVKIFYDDYMDANKTLDIFSNPGTKYLASPLSTLFNKKGYISPIDLEITMSDLINLIDEDSHRDIIKLKRRVNKEKKPDESVEVTFSTVFVPRSVSVINFMFKVTPIIIPPRRCHYCQIFRHSLEQCRSTHPICEYCAKWHFSDQCQNQQSKPKCSNCGGEHFSSSNDCPTFKYEFQVAKTSYLRNLSFLESQFWLANRGITPPVKIIMKCSLMMMMTILL